MILKLSMAIKKIMKKGDVTSQLKCHALEYIKTYQFTPLIVVSVMGLSTLFNFEK